MKKIHNIRCILTKIDVLRDFCERKKENKDDDYDLYIEIDKHLLQIEKDIWWHLNNYKNAKYFSREDFEEFVKKLDKACSW